MVNAYHIHQTVISSCRAEWNSWREEKLGEYVSDVRGQLDSDIELGAYILPPEFTECGQDLSCFASELDFVSPMAYYEDWGYDPDWVSSADCGIIHDTVRLAGEAEVIPALNMPENDEAREENNRLLSDLKKNYPEIKSIDYFVYGKYLAGN